MMYDEFQKLAGYEVSYDDYKNIIEPMYLAVDLDKEEFIKTLNRRRFEVIHVKSEEDISRENKLKAEIESLNENIKFWEERIEMREWFIKTETDKELIKGWKEDIKNYKEYIRKYKTEIKNIKFILDK